jgi:hypothetical protein
MKTNWLKITNRINQDRYKIPDGWETKEQVAESLQCAPDKVPDLLKAGINAGDIEKAQFPIWSDARRMAVPTTCYREAQKDQPQAKHDLAGRIADAIRRFPALSNSAIAKRFHVSHGVKAADVERVRQAGKSAPSQK